jgi:hypothetical protein
VGEQKAVSEARGHTLAVLLVGRFGLDSMYSMCPSQIVMCSKTGERIAFSTGHLLRWRPV